MRRPVVLILALLGGPLSLWSDEKPPASAQPTIVTDQGDVTPAPAPAKSAPVPAKENPQPASTPTAPPLSNPQFKITKVHEVRNDDTYKTGDNAALAFERDYWNFGAITEKEKQARIGHYFVFSWLDKGMPEPLTARFEFRQDKTRDVVRTLSLDQQTRKGANRSTFAVTGDAFAKYGAVYSWRFTLLRGETVVAEQKSYVW